MDSGVWLMKSKMRFGSWRKVIGSWLQGMDHIRELDGVADEENGEVVAHKIPVAVFRVELHRKAAWVPGDFGRVTSADHGGESDGERRLLAGRLEQLGASVLGGRFVADLACDLKLAIAHEPAGMDNPLRNTFTVEVGDLLKELVVLQRGRAAAAHGALGLIVGDRMALPVCQHLIRSARRCFGVLVHGCLP